eukprot:scaffold42863_cov17-Tisochrysis_lutea.AAC.1
MLAQPAARKAQAFLFMQVLLLIHASPAEPLEAASYAACIHSFLIIIIQVCFPAEPPGAASVQSPPTILIRVPAEP